MYGINSIIYWHSRTENVTLRTIFQKESEIQRAYNEINQVNWNKYTLNLVFFRVDKNQKLAKNENPERALITIHLELTICLLVLSSPTKRCENYQFKLVKNLDSSERNETFFIFLMFIFLFYLNDRIQPNCNQQWRDNHCIQEFQKFKVFFFCLAFPVMKYNFFFLV